MTTLSVIADDLTGACDVGAELATAGFEVRVAVDGADRCDGRQVSSVALRVLNTQSRGLGASEAYEQVLRAVRRRPAPVLLKKIDSALRGHLGAELDAALDALGARLAFVLPAIPAAGRTTRGGWQWFGGVPLAATEFAADPEAAGAESSLAVVMARESGRRAAVIGTRTVADGTLAKRVRELERDGVELVVIDAESDGDVTAAVDAILELPPPLCLAGSTALAGALARRLMARETAVADCAGGLEELAPDGLLRGPALVVCGSLHSTARAQIAAALDAGLAVEVKAAGREVGGGALGAAAATACSALAAGSNVVVSAVLPTTSPDLAARRATESSLAALACEVVRKAARVPALVLIGGETSYAVLTSLGADEIAVRGRLAPLVAAGEMVSGAAAGAALVTKGGSGGGSDTLVRLLAGGVTGGGLAAGRAAGRGGDSARSQG